MSGTEYKDINLMLIEQNKIAKSTEKESMLKTLVVTESSPLYHAVDDHVSFSVIVAESSDMHAMSSHIQ